MASNSLGTFPFVTFTNPASFNGAPLLTRMENEIIQRPGVHGTGIRRLGVKGMTFKMISTRDNATMADAIQEYNLYADLTNDDAQVIVFKGVNFDNYGVRYVVLNVSDPDTMPLSNTAGGLLGPLASAVKLTVIWTLQPVTLSQLGGQLTQG